MDLKPRMNHLFFTIMRPSQHRPPDAVRLFAEAANSRASLKRWVAGSSCPARSVPHGMRKKWPLALTRFQVPDIVP